MTKNWSPGSLPGELKSHPNKPLRGHLTEVAALAASLADQQGCPLDRFLLQTAAETHDLGKAHPAFQRYLLKQGKGVDHSFPSSLFTLQLTGDLWAAEAVRRHHGAMVDLEEAISFWTHQVTYASACRTMRGIVPRWTDWMSEDKWNALFGDLLLFGMPASHHNWLTLRTLLSLLAAADRLNALGVEQATLEPVPDFQSIPYVEHTAIDRWRSALREQVLDNARSISQPGVYSLTLPTGAGKTALGLEIAHHWVRQWKMNSILYSLPFISVVEQNAAVAGTLFDRERVQEDHSQLEEDTGSGEGSPLQKMIWLFRYWNDPVVVTTLAKLWGVLFKPRANAAMNFYRLYNSVVILDEPQGISPRLWDGLGRVFSFLSRECHTSFILMTATQPLVAVDRELAPPDSTVPVNRHEYRIIPGTHTVPDLPELLSDQLNDRNQSGLLVFNTRKSALEGYRLVREHYPDRTPLLFLSRWMTPHHRRRTLRILRFREKKGRPCWLIATQVVEAGMDLDFAWVFRDLGPLDSIVQVAGRCNRHFRHEQPGQVLVAELTDERRSLSEYVYHPVLLDKTRRVLEHHPRFQEAEVNGLIQDYYREIREGLTPEPLWESLENGQWTSLPPPFEEKYIEQDMAFVEENPQVRHDLETMLHTTWTLEKRGELKRLKQRLNNHLIEVNHQLLVEWQEDSGSLFFGTSAPPIEEYPGGRTWLITRQGMGSIYHPVTGFNPCPARKESDDDEFF